VNGSTARLNGSRLLRAAGYESHMLGKWHLGSFLQDYTPAGRGSASHGRWGHADTASCALFN
jgi:arylsulfatase A-like enzyme